MESKKKSKEEFRKETSSLRKLDMQYFLSNVLNLIWYDGYYYCFYKKFEGLDLEFSKGRCTLCRFPFIFYHFEKKLDVNSENYLYLRAYHQKLLPFLFECYNVDPTSIEYFMTVCSYHVT